MLMIYYNNFRYYFNLFDWVSYYIYIVIVRKSTVRRADKIRIFKKKMREVHKLIVLLFTYNLFPEISNQNIKQEN
jgi:hypothetical protein